MRAGYTMGAPTEDGPRNVAQTGLGYLEEADIAAGADSHETAGKGDPIDGLLRRGDGIGADQLGTVQAHELNPSILRAEPISRFARTRCRAGDLEIRQADRANVHILVAVVGPHQR